MKWKILKNRELITCLALALVITGTSLGNFLGCILFLFTPCGIAYFRRGIPYVVRQSVFAILAIGHGYNFFSRL